MNQGNKFTSEATSFDENQNLTNVSKNTQDKEMAQKRSAVVDLSSAGTNKKSKVINLGKKVSEEPEKNENLGFQKATSSTGTEKRSKKPSLKAAAAAAGKSSEPLKRKRCQAKTVNKRLEQMGIKPESVSSCVKSAMTKGHITITGNKSDLEQIIKEGEFEGHNFTVKLKDVLHQPDYAGLDYEDGCQDATAVCSCCEDGEEDYPVKCYVTRICEGYPTFDSGKFHNHCELCKGFGKCIGDYRMAHCEKCNKHWFTGLQGMPCDNCERMRGRGFRGLPGLAAFAGLADHDESDDEGENSECVIA